MARGPASSWRWHPVTAGHPRGGQHHQHYERGLDEADLRETVRRPSFRHSAAGRDAAPLDQRDHRPQLKDENRGEQAHLRPEEVIMEIVEAALLESAKRPYQAGADPKDRSDAPPGIGIEGPA